MVVALKTQFSYRWCPIHLTEQPHNFCLKSLQTSCFFLLFNIRHQREGKIPVIKILILQIMYCKNFSWAKIFTDQLDTNKMSLRKPHLFPVAQTGEAMASNFRLWFKKAFGILLLSRSVLVADSLITALSSRSSLPLSNVAGSLQCA